MQCSYQIISSYCISTDYSFSASGWVSEYPATSTAWSNVCETSSQSADAFPCPSSRTRRCVDARTRARDAGPSRRRSVYQSTSYLSAGVARCGWIQRWSSELDSLWRSSETCYPCFSLSQSDILQTVRSKIMNYIDARSSRPTRVSAERSWNGAERAENGMSGSGGAWTGRPSSWERVSRALSGISAAYAPLTCSVLDWYLCRLSQFLTFLNTVTQNNNTIAICEKWMVLINSYCL